MNNIKMNEAQRRAIRHGEGPARVLAGPGSGKTFVIVQRLRYLIKELHVEPSSILVITFTKVAAEEMRKRFYQLMDNEPYPVHFGTFHAIFYSILKQSNPDFSKQVLSESDKINLIDKLRIPFEKQFPEESLPVSEELIKQIGKFKNVGEIFERLNAGTGSFMEKSSFLWIYSSYNKLLRQEEKIDFDDMAKQCLELFQNNPDILTFWQKYFQYVLVDEFQDINAPQMEVIKYLAGMRRNIFVVGDDDQSIYGFRGANPKIMKHFLEEYPDSECILLDTNYRSSKAIVDAAGKCIAINKERVEKKIHAAKQVSKEAKQQAVVIKSFAKKAEEQQYLIERIRKWRKDGYCYEDAAIICRTNFELEEIALLMEKEKIPFQRREKKKSIFEHPIMQDFEAYLKIADGEKKRSLFLRIINHPTRFIGRTFFTKEEMGISELKEACKSVPEKYFKVLRLEKDCEKIKKMSPFLAVNYIRKGVGYDTYLKELAAKSKERLEQFIDLADFFQNHGKEFRTSTEWLNAIAKHKAEFEMNPEQKKEGVHLLTMHGAKGLEFPLVILPDVNEGIVPRGRSLSKEEVEEERRMFYVAMTRAEEYLEMYYVSGEDERKRLPSRFIKPLLEKQSK